MIVFDTFDELTLRHDVFSLLFSEIHTWIEKSIKHTRKAWRTKEVDWGSIPYIPNILHQANTSLLVQGKKESKSNTFWMLDSDCMTEPSCNSCHEFIRTPIGAFLDFTESLSSLLSNGSRLTSISFRSWPQSSFSFADIFCPGAASSYFGPMGRVSSLGPLGTRPRVGVRHQHPCGRPPTSLYPLAAANNTWVFFRSSLALATC
jgi:hypothetical protein